MFFYLCYARLWNFISDSCNSVQQMYSKKSQMSCASGGVQGIQDPNVR